MSKIPGYGGVVLVTFLSVAPPAPAAGFGELILDPNLTNAFQGILGGGSKWPDGPILPIVDRGRPLSSVPGRDLAPCRVFFESARRSSPPLIDEVLRRCPVLQDLIVWETGTGERIPYRRWSDADKARFQFISRRLSLNARYDLDYDLGIGCAKAEAPGNVLRDMGWYPYEENIRGQVEHFECVGSEYSCPRETTLPAKIYFTRDHAFDVFAAHVAWALFLEAERALRWSLFSGSFADLQEIFDSSAYFSPIKRIAASPFRVPSEDYEQADAEIQKMYPDHVLPGRDYQRPMNVGVANYTICDPRIGYLFMQGSKSSQPADPLIADTAELTLARLSLWSKMNLHHGGSSVDTDSLHRAVTYDRMAAAENAPLKERLKRSPATDDRGLIVAHGCRGAAALLYDLARSVNIPLKRVRTERCLSCEGHAGMVFRTLRSGLLEAQVVWHLDELYGAIAQYNGGAHFSVDTSGNWLSGDAAAVLYFNTHWTPSRTIESWGFDYKDDLPTDALVDREYLPTTRRAYAGFWIENTPEAPETLSHAFQLEKAFRLCAEAYLETYCDTELGGDIHVANSIRPEVESYAPWVPVRTAEEYGERAEVCMMAIAGGRCARSESLIEAFVLRRGVRFWAD